MQNDIFKIWPKGGYVPLKEEIFANQVFSGKLIFANEKIQLFWGNFRN